MKLIEELKSHSSKWIKTKDENYKKFYWQNGYGGFSVNPKQLEVIKNYISNQELHHKNKSFKEEYLELLKENEIEYDERYVWD